MYDKMKVKYNEGSMLTTPEMELEDTYSNIPEDEVEAAEASQLPDDEMVDTSGNGALHVLKLAAGVKLNHPLLSGWKLMRLAW